MTLALQNHWEKSRVSINATDEQYEPLNFFFFNLWVLPCDSPSPPQRCLSPSMLSEADFDFLTCNYNPGSSGRTRYPSYLFFSFVLITSHHTTWSASYLFGICSLTLEWRFPEDRGLYLLPRITWNSAWHEVSAQDWLLRGFWINWWEFPESLVETQKWSK